MKVLDSKRVGFTINRQPLSYKTYNTYLDNRKNFKELPKRT